MLRGQWQTLPPDGVSRAGGEDSGIMIFAHHTDQDVIRNARGGSLRGYKPGQKELPVAAIQGVKAETYREPRVTCLVVLAGIFLLPFPFIII